VLAHGFARLACAGCRAEVLVPFSCKSRGVCPSCNARRAQDTAIHLVERVLPRAPYRQWTLSLPMPVRFSLARDSRLLSEVLGLFVRALFAFQRRTARRLGVSRPLTGAVLIRVDDGGVIAPTFGGSPHHETRRLEPQAPRVLPSRGAARVAPGPARRGVRRPPRPRRRHEVRGGPCSAHQRAAVPWCRSTSSGSGASVRACSLSARGPDESPPPRSSSGLDD
jgi:hypothetical protein